MKLISHRGNIDQINSELENSPKYILDAIKSGYDVEIDLWLKNEDLLLGHDFGKFKINEDFISDIMDSLWIHAKNDEALFYLNKSSYKYNFFWHDTDNFIFTSQKYIWTHFKTNILYFKNDYTVGNNTILVMPERIDIFDMNEIKKKNYFGICSDLIKQYK